MNLGDLKTELSIILGDPSIESSFDSFLNNEMLQLSYEFDLPTLRLKTPAVLTTISTAWQYDLRAASHPAGHLFQKKLFKVTNSTFLTGMRIETDLQIIDEIDSDHNETGEDVQRVAYELDGDGAILGTWPMANDSLNLWFFRHPRPMVMDSDVPEFPSAYHFDVLIPRVVLRAFRVYPELATAAAGDATRALALWTQRYQAGLYGDGGSIGLLDALRKSRPVRQRGPRPGMGLAGADRGMTWR